MAWNDIPIKVEIDRTKLRLQLLNITYKNQCDYCKYYVEECVLCSNSFDGCTFELSDKKIEELIRNSITMEE